MKVAKFSFLNKKSYNKTIIEFNLGRNKDISTQISDNSMRPRDVGDLSLFWLDKSFCHMARENPVS